MCVLLQVVGVAPLLVERCACELERAVLHLHVALLARYEGEADTGCADLAIGEDGCQVTHQRFVQMCGKRGTLVLDVNLAEELARRLVAVEDLHQVAGILDALRHLDVDVEVVVTLGTCLCERQAAKEQHEADDVLCHNDLNGFIVINYEYLL